MTDLWTEATHDDTAEQFATASSAAMRGLASITAGLLDATSMDGYQARLAVARPRIDAVIASATYSDPVLFARVQDDVLNRMEATVTKKLAWDAVANAKEMAKIAGSQEEIDAWFEGNVLPEWADRLAPLKEKMVYGPNYTRGVREKIGDAMFSLRQPATSASGRAYQESVLNALIGTVLNGEQWRYVDDWDAENEVSRGGVYVKALKMAEVTKVASKGLEEVAKAFASYWGGEFTGIDSSPVSLIDGLWDGPWATVKNEYGEWAKIKDISGEDSGQIENHRPNPDFIEDPDDPYSYMKKGGQPPYIYDKIMRPAGTYAVVYYDREVQHINTKGGQLVLEGYNGDVPLSTTSSKKTASETVEVFPRDMLVGDQILGMPGKTVVKVEYMGQVQDGIDAGDGSIYHITLSDGTVLPAHTGQNGPFARGKKTVIRLDPNGEPAWKRPGSTSSKTAADDYYDKQSDPDSKHDFVGSDERCRVCGFTHNHVIHKSASLFSEDLKRRAAFAVADGQVFSEKVTRNIYVTALRHQGAIHWAVTDESGDEEAGSGVEQSLRDALEQAKETIEQVIQQADGGTPDPNVAPQAAPDAPAVPAQAEGTPDVDPAESQTVDPADPSAPAPDDEDPASDSPVPEDPANPVAATDNLEDTDAGAPEATNPVSDAETLDPDAADPSADPSDDSDPSADPSADPEDAADDTAAPDVADAVPDELQDDSDGDGTPDADEVVDSAEDTSEGDITGIDPKSMQVGDRTNMTYTLSDGTTGDVDVTFVREDNDIFFFDGPNGEFGIGERDEDDGGTIWVDAEGQTFAFADGDALEEVTGDEIPGEAEVADIDLEAPASGPTDDSAPPAPAAEGDDAPAAPAEDDAPPADDAAPAADDSEDDDSDDEDDDDFKKKFGSILLAMAVENPNVPVGQLTALARRSAHLSIEMGTIPNG